ncbi:MAG: phosphoribosylanthranilate isomerase [Rhodospirillaceae bacterium]|nr:phosphoribosylanthranilate isomerase [Rhodospirillaceae bacterium]
MRVDVKICGLTSPEALAAAIDSGARYVGLVFYPPSPRAVGLEVAAELARMVPTGVRAVGLFVDPTDEALEATVRSVPLDMLQLHGHETPERVAAIRARFAMPVMKAVRVAEPADLDHVPAHAAVADRLLFDAKPPQNVAALPGGNGIPFDWSILSGRHWPVPWMLSGGLTVDNVGQALAETGAAAVDVSSGVEARPGVKDPAKIAAFMRAVTAAAVGSEVSAL